MTSFFDKNYRTPLWFTEKEATNLSRRGFLKSAAGATTIAAIPTLALTQSDKARLQQLVKSDPWKTLEATLNHLLPKSATGPSAVDINALAYLHQVMTVQPTPQPEKEFILKGVGWLNGFANSEYQKNFVALTTPKKESLLRSISRSQAGENWLNILLGYIFEAMLTPPSYGGNPNGVGWQWLEHQAGFPLPKKGQRYFELPPRSQVGEQIAVKNVEVARIAKTNKTKIKRSSKA